MAARKTSITKKSQQTPSRPKARKKAVGGKTNSRNGAGSASRTSEEIGKKNGLVYVANSPIHGKGLFARKKLKANLTLGNIEGRPTRRDGTYVLWLSDTDGLRVTNDFRFINHSGTPNCALTGSKVVTLKAIKADEELTHDYGW
jgi:SET domain-containing protein